MKIAHLKLTKDLLKNEASLDTPKNIDEKKRSLNADFCKIWTHPHMGTLDEDDKLIINLKHDEVGAFPAHPTIQISKKSRISKLYL